MNKKERQIAFSAVLGFIDEQGTLKRVTEALGIDYSVARMEVAQEYFQKLGVDFTGLNTSGDWVALLEDEKEEEKILDWGEVADGVLINSAGAFQPFLFKRDLFAGCRKLTDIKLDTEHWNAWRGGECPFGQPEAVEIEFEFRDGEIQTGTADEFRWEHIEDAEEGDIIHYRVIGLVDPWRYPE